MITSVEFKNFQPHHNTSVTFHPHINVIQGVSDSGKSAFLRAMDAVLRRAPFYITFGKDEGQNTIVFDEKDVVSRTYIKTKLSKCPACKEKLKTESQVCESCGEFLPVKSSVEFYMINDEKRDRFGKELPDFITDITRIKPIEILDNEIFLNFAKQHEPMFFVSETYTGSLRNKMISMLIPDSDKIDILIKDLSSEKLSTSANIKVYSKQQTIAEESLKMIQSDYDYLETTLKTIENLSCDIRLAENKLNRLVALQSQLNRVLPIANLSGIITKVQDRIKNADSHILNAQDIEKRLRTLKNIDNSLQSFNKYVNVIMPDLMLLSDAGTKINDVIKKQTMIESLIKCKTSLNKIKIAKLPKIPVVSFPDDIVFKIDQLKCLSQNYTTLGKRISDGNRDIVQIKKELIDLQEESKLDKMICPITNKPFCKDCVEAITNEFV